MHSFSAIKPVRSRYVSGIVLTMLLTSSCNTTVQSPESLRQSQRLEPTGQSITFDASSYTGFSDYIVQMQRHLSAYKVYLNPRDSAAELAAALPFIVTPDEVDTIVDCDAQVGTTSGIVLFHGLSDTPAAMRDLATEFARRCFVSYSMLLPGHGARPAELLEVTRNDWLAAAQFAIESMKTQVDHTYVGGFSLGGLIALRSAMIDPEIKAVFAFSPAFALHRSLYLDQTVWLRHLVDWIDTDPPDDPWRFESMPFNALAETQILRKSVRKKLVQQPLETPVFIAQSSDDAIVNAAKNLDLFEHYMTYEGNRLISYEKTTGWRTADGRVIRYPSVLPDQKIVAYAHQAVHVSADNTHYGARGQYRNCQINEVNTSDEDVHLCRTIDRPYWGEVFGNALDRVDTREITPLARLTFNPQFSALLKEIDRFLVNINR